jgi:hypothetical protein
MGNMGSGQFTEHFGNLPDLRIERSKRYTLIDIVVTAWATENTCLHNHEQNCPHEAVLG